TFAARASVTLSLTRNARTPPTPPIVFAQVTEIKCIEVGLDRLDNPALHLLRQDLTVGAAVVLVPFLVPEAQPQRLSVEGGGRLIRPDVQRPVQEEASLAVRVGGVFQSLVVLSPFRSWFFWVGRLRQ